jgi:ATP-dependent DNA helicase DinG
VSDRPSARGNDSAWLGRVAKVFEAGGELSKANVHFRPRQGQQRMAALVAQTIEDESALVVEAGTGTGKTYAYLAPALLSGKRVLVSTATKALQDQLFLRDLPRLIQLLGTPIRVALLKGRNNYLCTHRLNTHLHSGAVADRFTSNALQKVQRWAVTSRSGDLSDMPGLDQRSSVVPLITSNRDNCLGSQCPDFKTCHLQAARREALAADLVVVNHHLFFADQAVRESGMAELLPSVDVVIFDEAHQLNEIGVLFLGTQLSSPQLLDFNRDVLAAGLQHARGLCDWSQRCSALERSIRDLRLCLPSTQSKTSIRLAWAGQAPQSVDEAAWHDCLRDLSTALGDVRADVSTVQEMAPDFERLMERCDTLVQRLAHLLRPVQDDHVRWLEAGAHWRWVDSPLDSAQAFAASGPDSDMPGPKSWIFTSATLGDDEQLDWFAQPLGLTHAQRAVVASPFDFAVQAALWVPKDLPMPNEPGHPLMLARRVAPWVQRLGGRTMVLTTSLRALNIIAQELREQLKTDAVEVLVQGELSKNELLERFRAYAHGTRARNGEASAYGGAVLVASVSFWEGVDVPGDALQLVVLDKLPFPVPDDPLTQARAKRLQAAGQSPFTAQVLPDTAVALKQGAGRLIRAESDKGVLVIGDQRLVTMGYGKRLLQAMPPMQRLASEADMLAYLDGLLTTATTTT